MATQNLTRQESLFFQKFNCFAVPVSCGATGTRVDMRAPSVPPVAPGERWLDCTEIVGDIRNSCFSSW